MTRITGSLHQDQYIFTIISRLIFRTVRNVTVKSCTENQNTHFTFSNFFPKIETIYETMWKNGVRGTEPLRKSETACTVYITTN